MKKKLTAVALIVCMLAIMLVGASLAYFTDEHSVENTFTAGKVGIALDEAAVVKAGENDVTDTIKLGDYIDSKEDRVTTTQKYDLHPGQTILKDPTITVDTDSLNAYVAAKITVTGGVHGYKVKGEDGAEYVNVLGVPGYDNIDINVLASGGLMKEAATQQTGWNGLSMVYATDSCVIYQEADKANGEYVLYVFMNEAQAADAKIVLFDTLTIPSEWGNDEMACLNDMKIDVKAYAVQTEGFADCYKAMTTAFASDFAF